MAARVLTDRGMAPDTAIGREIAVGMCNMYDDELAKLRHAVGLAQTRQTFDPMQEAWNLLRTVLAKKAEK